MSTFSTTARPAMFLAVRSTSGAARRHGPHQAAQKSTSTGTDAELVTESKRSASASIGSATGGSGALHCPHCPVSARCSGGTRFFVWQDGHSRMKGARRRSFSITTPG